MERPGSTNMVQPLMGNYQAHEQEKVEEETRVQNMELCLKIAMGVIALLVVKILLFSPNGSECAAARIEQMEKQIFGLETIWAVPENALLNAKYAKLHHDLSNYSTEVKKMSSVYSNIAEIRSKLGRVRGQISDIHILKENGIAEIADVNKTLQDLKDYTKTIDSQLHNGLQKISADAVDIAKRAVIPAVSDMRKDIDANEKKSADALQENLNHHWSEINARVKRLNSTLDKEASQISSKIDKHTKSLSTSVEAKIDASRASISKALAIASAAKSAGDEARTTAQSAIASIKGVGFIKHAGQACPEGSESCTIWHWMSPQNLDPYCGAKGNEAGNEWADGSCGTAQNGELQNRMYGCCRKK